ncbi:hypothetical protein VOLCADRAFT_106683 [Volvox carteri f. nagariensis]|uniref:Uncharacterized protein n=1 Tax=Volvox carteri f. nagariensis TaxID=3068 RepID=D8U928_VOLCA|nr:uncharacterized protein VOLCADRAFT_106683 [Volvox carteri f. nagariensis]EFJ43677.1 hypothetical protein VOLCADRAFT_106683 [Volvox carteri f. nagariensis]|eukprot:XP_002955158.1 hypothetical protein VOLCADRAFT_106683 [Volvox carteri f. nagariensis]
MSQNQSPSPVPSENFPTSLHNALMATIQQPLQSPLPRLFSVADVHAATQAAQQQEMAQRLHSQGLGMQWSQTPLSQVNALLACNVVVSISRAMPTAMPFGHAGFNVFNSQPGIFNAQPGVQLPPGQLLPTFVMGVAPPTTSKASKKAAKAKGAKASRPSVAVPPAMDGQLPQLQALLDRKKLKCIEDVRNAITSAHPHTHKPPHPHTRTIFPILSNLYPAPISNLCIPLQPLQGAPSLRFDADVHAAAQAASQSITSKLQRYNVLY